MSGPVEAVAERFRRMAEECDTAARKAPTGERLAWHRAQAVAYRNAASQVDNLIAGLTDGGA